MIINTLEKQERSFYNGKRSFYNGKRSFYNGEIIS